MIVTPSTVDNFYITQDVKNTPSRREGIDELCEFNLRAYGASLIASACELLDVDFVVTSTAQTLLHRFYTKKSLGEYCVKATATASITLACKLEENTRKTRDVLNCIRRAQELAEGKPKHIVPINTPQYEKSKTESHFMEMLMLREFGFFAHCSPPHKYAYALCAHLNLDEELTRNVWVMCNDSFLTPLCVRFKPDVIACGCIYLAARRASVALPTAPPWWRLVDGAELVDLEIIAKTLLALYEIDERFEYKHVFGNSRNVDSTKPTSTRDRSRDRDGGRRRSRSPARGEGERRVRRRDSRDFRDRSRN